MNANVKSKSELEREAIKDLEKACQSKTLFRLKGDPTGDWRTVLSPYSPAVRKWLENRYGKNLAIICNEDVVKAVQTEGSYALTWEAPSSETNH